ncbi:hypothetical protein BFF78_30140 [Streptomyces fodineus]|uniref:Uncharacterized protein n=1 Tax=Streptomyces fodineus TaxID=1904616 RepID=A0A1D7YGL2_9ACTN|nr:hypothetical protein [Streptomyces fodineus]AOR34745.1 hypothetical protein BFF78_30140 [Streptomyces fodineus]
MRHTVVGTGRDQAQRMQRRRDDGCSSAPWISGLFPTSPTLPLHPYATGERAMADAVLSALGR